MLGKTDFIVLSNQPRYPQALYLIMNNRSMLSMSLTMAQAYDQHSDEDGFLYITYASQEVFGYQDGEIGEGMVSRIKNL